MNLAGSKMNLAGSRGNLFGSKANIAGSRYGSIRNLTNKNNAIAAEQTSSNPTTAIVYENTYKLKPDKSVYETGYNSHGWFPTNTVKLIIEETLAKHLAKVKYDCDIVPELVKTIANDVMQSVKGLELDRYKIVVDVNVGEFKGQGIKVASRAVWDTTTDSYASASFKNATLFAVAIVFGCYYE
ncbi:hypothetical protein BDEG_26883 [Batrachochytrium dendrobatidis JEL423]|uniref:Tctex-1 family protein n=1 Tax=Batrachochytrium dendrobatidis (strain JEL423) TaxID=403673 RepID=A0A177WVS8_BATDL|nr:hypothetical protein BDEG_26883 [Batrachochytrium dendrobatidis JEL423]